MALSVMVTISGAVRTACSTMVTSSAYFFIFSVHSVVETDMMVGEKDADSLVEIQTGIWVDKL